MVNFTSLSVTEKAKFLGMSPEGFSILSEDISAQGVLEINYTYADWLAVDLKAVKLIVPIMDSGYCQIIDVKQ